MKAGADYADARTGTDESRVPHGPQPGDAGHRSLHVLGGRGACPRRGAMGLRRDVTSGRTGGRSHGDAGGRDREGGRRPPRDPRRALPGRAGGCILARTRGRGPVHRSPRGEGGPADGGHPPDADRAGRDLRGGRSRSVPPLHLVRLLRRRRDRPDGRALRRWPGGDGHRRRRRAAPLVPQLVPWPHQGRGVGARPDARADRGGGAHRARGRRTPVGARVPERGHHADPRQRPGGVAGPRVDRTSDRARSRARDGGGLRRVVVPHDRGPGQAEVRQPARLGHRGCHAARRTRLVRLRRRRRSRAAGADPGGRHLPELPDQPRDGAGRRSDRPTAPVAPTGGRTCR